MLPPSLPTPLQAAVGPSAAISMLQAIFFKGKGLSPEAREVCLRGIGKGGWWRDRF